MSMKHYMMLLILILLCAYNTNAQSRQGYIHAGEDAMKMHDPVAATGFYMQALEYSSDAELLQKTALAWKARFNYENAIEWFRKSLADNSCNHNDSISIQIQLSDLLKRTSHYDEATQIANSIHTTQKSDSIIRDSLINDLHLTQLNAKQQLPLFVDPAATINTGFSDFAPAVFKDTLYYSSRQFPVKGSPGNYRSRIMSSAIVGNDQAPPQTLPSPVNSTAWDNANASISPDGKLMLFARCKEDDDHQLMCSLFESKNIDNKWSEPVRLRDSINVAGYTSTQPSVVTNMAAGYIVYFASNRPGGAGKNDIWKTTRDAAGKYSMPVNMKFNTPSDEITPFADQRNNVIYFASDRTGTAGGYDLWIYHPSADSTSNVGIPLNSGYDDLYYTAGITDTTYRYIVSNRPPSKLFKGESCCYDIFRITDNLEVIDSVRRSDSIANALKDSAVLVQRAEVAANEMRDLFPLRLYFDNDYPDPRSRSATTKTVYSDLLKNYLDKENLFETEAESPAEKQSISVFFRDSVLPASKRLEQFNALLERVLQAGLSVSFTAHGSASPLADNRYNLILSQRRIRSVLNDWAESDSEIIREAMRDGRIRITEDATGEETVGNNVSDRRDLVSRSVYSTAASVLRRIEITGITTSKP